MRVPARKLAKLLRHAVAEEKNQAAWDVWVACYPQMDKENFMSFEEFKKEAYKNAPRASDKTLDEIEAEMDAIIRAHESEAKT